MSEPNPVVSADDVKADVVWVARELLRSGLVEGTAGNIAARLPDGTVVVTPSSLDYREMTVDDLVVCDLAGNRIDGHRDPTTELALHLRALRSPEIGASVHCHAKHATMFAITHTPIPAVVEEFAIYVGGDVDVAEYRVTGSEELAETVAAHVENRAAVLMANHGLFTVGRSPKDALHVALLVERTAEIVWGARALGPVVGLPEEVRASFAELYRLGRGRASSPHTPGTD